MDHVGPIPVDKSAAHMDDRPEYPLAVRLGDGEVEIIADEDEACCNLEWIDTDDAEDPVVVTDARGRRVRLKIAALVIEICELLHDRA